MVVHPAPTSPKARLQQPEPTIARMEQPPRSSVGRIWLISALTGLLMSLLVVIGLVWFVRAYPDTPVSQWFLVETTQTVIERPSSTSSTLPTAVSRTVDSLGFVVQNNAGEIRTQDDIRGLAAVLSSSGWFVTRSEILPDTNAQLVQPGTYNQNIETRLTDPASSFVFGQTDRFDQAPIQFAQADQLRSGQRVWVVQPTWPKPTVITEQLGKYVQPSWQLADHQESWWTLSSIITNAGGNLVLTDAGLLIGWLDTDQRVWPATIIDPILPGLIQTGGVIRPWIGFRYLVPGMIVTESSDPQLLLVSASGADAAIIPDSPADTAGLRSGDILRQIDGISIDNLPDWASWEPGEAHVIQYERDGQLRETTLNIDRLRP